MKVGTRKHEELFVKTPKAQRRKYGEKGDEQNRVMVRCMNQIVWLYVTKTDYEEAEDLFTEGIQLGDKELSGKDHPYTIETTNDLGLLRCEQKRYEEAEMDIHFYVKSKYFIGIFCRQRIQ